MSFFWPQLRKQTSCFLELRIIGCYLRLDDPVQSGETAAGIQKQIVPGLKSEFCRDPGWLPNGVPMSDFLDDVIDEFVCIAHVVADMTNANEVKRCLAEWIRIVSAKLVGNEGAYGSDAEVRIIRYDQFIKSLVKIFIPIKAI